MDYNETLEFLYSRLPVFHHVGKAAYKPGLGNTIEMMNALGHPERRFKTIHVGGTNGKGSVSHSMASILQAKGLKVGLYTSPHLVDFGERIRINGVMISQEYVVRFVENNRLLFERVQPSFFEATMAMAFCYFEAENVDVAIIEVGMGGRLDSTNIINPELSIITNISLDHVSYLGDSLAQIAYEKAGIIKHATPVVVGEYLNETRPVFEKMATEMQAELTFAQDELSIGFDKYEDDKMQVLLPDGSRLRLGLSGLYQLKNVATVLVAIQKLNDQGWLISNKQIEKGLEFVCEQTGLQGRWQTMMKHPKVVMDTGHNLAGVQYVCEQLKTQTYNQLHILIGMVNDKDVSGVLAILPKDAMYYFTQANIARALPADELRKMAMRIGLQGECYATVQEGVKAVLSQAERDDFVFIGGSNFVVGEALEYFRDLK